jgi:hypothetical protein
MTALTVPTFQPVRFGIANVFPGPAAELLREPLKDAEIVRSTLRKLRRGLDIVLMASGKGDYLNAAFRNEVLGAAAFSAPATAYFAMWTTAAATNLKAYVGNTAGEVSGGSYDRVAKTNNTTNFASISGASAKVNSNAITWTTASADWNSGSTIPQFIVFDGNAKTGADNNLLWGDWTVAKSVLNGDTAQINTSGFSWTET